MSVEYWTTGTDAGSGEAWTAAITSRVDNFQLFTIDAVTEPVNPSAELTNDVLQNAMDLISEDDINIIQQPTINIEPSEQVVGGFSDWTTVINLFGKDIISKDALYTLAEGEYKKIVQEDVNKKVHDIIKRKLKC